MKEHYEKVTLQETEQLCRLYMDCQLTVLEETELQYVLGKLPYSSPCIDEVRMLMGLKIQSRAIKTSKMPFRFSRNKTAFSIAASFVVLLGIGIALIIKASETPTYIAAYQNGEQLNRDEAIISTSSAMAKADSLMNYASLTEYEYMMKANDIISKTSNY